MRKIDPKELLDCLDSLLGKKGGIKGESEVKRMADLMTKFSKKLVSKCIYIQILKNTDPDLLIKFMAEGGWALVFQWLDEGIGNNNYALIREILELLLVCPISLDRLKENNCPKVVKGLSKDSEVEEVKRLACKLVEKWLKFIKSGQAAISDVAMAAATTGTIAKPATITVPTSRVTVVTSVPSSVSNNVKKVSNVPRKISKLHVLRGPSSSDESDPEADEEVEQDAEEEEEDDEDVDEDEDEMPPIGSLPLYKITVRDGKSVLAKVGTKTLTLPIAKKTETESVVLKSADTKNFRYVTKTVTDKSGGGDADKSDLKTNDKLRTNPVCILQRLDGLGGDISGGKAPSIGESDTVDSVKAKNSECIVKTVSSSSTKSSKEDKVRDGQFKVSKSHSKDRDNNNKNASNNNNSSSSSSSSESKHKVKDKKSESSKDSDKDKKRSEHKNHSSVRVKDKDRDRDRDKEKIRSSKDGSSSSSTSGSRHGKESDNRNKTSSKDSSSKLKDGKDAKPLTAAEKAQIQADKDKDTLERLKTPAISILGKIPKKSSSLPGSTGVESKTTTTTTTSDATTPKSTLPKPTDSPQSGDKVSSKTNSGDTKKNSTVSTDPLSRTSRDRPKTVKTFNSKFRSTGLEEEVVKPPPSRSSLKKKIDEKRPPLPVKSEKHSSTGKEEQPAEKKAKIDILAEIKKEKVVDKPGAIKLIPPKPKPALLESDMFSDALTASTKFEPRKRKRRVSNSKDAPAKDTKEETNTQEATSPKEMKPALKFYRDTLEDDEEKSKESASDVKVESDSEDPSKPTSEEPSSKLYPNGVLVYKAKRGPKKSVKWKEESDLTTIRYFELDENERVNVTRNFVDMKLMERSHEREAFQLARKLASDDTMEERIPWGPLHEVDIPPERQSPVEPGRSSQEKSVQYAREKTVLQAIYFHRNSIPDSPAEPDVEIHPTTDPKIIPLEDITGNTDSVANFQNIPWPEPKPALIPSSPPPHHLAGGNPQQQQALHNPQFQQQFQQQMQAVLQAQAQQQHPQQGFPHPQGYSTVGNFAGFPTVGMPGMMPPGQAGNWRGTDGKDMGMNMNFQPNGPMCPQMNQPPQMFNPHGGAPDGFNMNGPPMGNFGAGFPPMNCDPGAMYGGPPPMGNMGGGPPQQQQQQQQQQQWNRGWDGGGGGGRGDRGDRGGGRYNNSSPKFQKGVCHHFAKFGNCARGNKCRFLHPN